MRTIYLDSDYICHLEPSEGLRKIETDVLDDRCNRVLEITRFIPQGEPWTDEHGNVYDGETVSVIDDFRKYMPYQEQFAEDNGIFNIITEGVPSDDES